MIKVDRGKDTCPKSLLKNGIKERDANIAIAKASLDDELSFNAYKGAGVLKALQTLFKKKCAYCESLYASVTPADIEHFRPKSKTFPRGTRKSGYIGYYWLAADWDNLLLSCPGCNRPGTHEAPGEAKPVTIGKSEQFPLEGDETYRCIDPDNAVAFQADEQHRLLINPCKEDPEIFFEFIEETKDAGYIKVKDGLNGLQSKMAQESIRVYALHRIDLGKARARLLDDIMERVFNLNREIGRFNNPSTAQEKQEAENYIKSRVDMLVQYALPEKQFSAMAKQVVGKFLSSLSTKLKALVGIR